MKKLIMALLAVTTMTTYAQEKRKTEDRGERKEQLTPEQRNELRLKRMTLELGLNASQQKDMSKIIAEQSAKMEAARAERKAKMESGKKPTADERFARESKKLDEQIALQDRVRKILTPEQFEKWDRMKEHRRHQMKEHMEKRKRHPMGPDEK